MMDRYFAARAQKFVYMVIIVSIIGLSTTPLLPWLAVEYQGGNTDYLTKAHISANATAIGAPAAYENLDKDLNVLSTSFWLALIFGIVALAGLAIYRSGMITIVGHILMLIACIMVVFGILAITSHWGLITHVDDLNDHLQIIGGGTCMYRYNYIPLIMGVLLLIGTIGYLTVVAPYCGKAFVVYMTTSYEDEFDYIRPSDFDTQQPAPKQPVRKGKGSG